MNDITGNMKVTVTDTKTGRKTVYEKVTSIIALDNVICIKGNTYSIRRFNIEVEFIRV